jgi:hypothetical protein
MPNDDFISEDTLETLQNIEQALGRIEAAVKDNSSSQLIVKPMIWGAYALATIFWVTWAWHSKWRYAAQYQVSPSHVNIVKEPHDCDFLYPPIGTKFCWYDPRASTVRWGRSSTTGQPIVSTDHGSTWYPFTPDAGVDVPTSSTVEGVNVNWVKNER